MVPTPPENGAGVRASLRWRSAEFSAKPGVGEPPHFMKTVAMTRTSLIAARVSHELKAKVRSLAERQQLTESAWLKRLIWLAMRTAGEPASQVMRTPLRRLRGARVCLRLDPQDRSLLTQRAAAAHMPVATYVSVVVRNHLRDLPSD